MKFRMIGIDHWTVGSCQDGRSQEINEEFEAGNEEEAIEKAKGIVEEHRKTRSTLTDYGMSVQLHAIKPIWKARLNEKQPAFLPVPAQPARPVVPEHFIEERLQ